MGISAFAAVGPGSGHAIDPWSCAPDEGDVADWLIANGHWDEKEEKPVGGWQILPVQIEIDYTRVGAPKKRWAKA